MSNIGSAPAQKPMSDERAWVQWFTELGDGLNGRWAQQQRALEKVNISATPAQEYLNYKGRELGFLFVWNSGVDFSNSEILLAREDLTMRPGMLEIWEDSALVGGAYCNERTIEFPDLSLSGRIIVQGSVMTKVTDPRRI